MSAGCVERRLNTVALFSSRNILRVLSDVIVMVMVIVMV